MILNFKIIRIIIFYLLTVFSFSMVQPISTMTTLVHLLPRIVEYGLIAKANKEFLDFQHNFIDVPADLSKLSMTDLKKYRRMNVFLIFAGICRLLESAHSGIRSYEVRDTQAYAHTKTDGKRFNGVDFLASETVYLYDFLSFKFDLLLFFLLMYKYGDVNEAISDLESIDKNSDEKDIKESTEELNTDNSGEIQDKNESSDINDTKIKQSKLIRALCIYVLPALEVGFAAWNDLTFEGKNSMSVKASAFRAKLKAIQLFARLTSEMLMCQKANKKFWLYAALFVLVAAKLVWDCGIEARDLSDPRARTPEQWKKLSDAWDNLYAQFDHRDMDLADRDIRKTNNELRESHPHLKSDVDAQNLHEGMENLQRMLLLIKPVSNPTVHALSEFGLKILGVDSRNEVNEKYRSLSKHYHPDKGDQNEVVQRLLGNVNAFFDKYVKIAKAKPEAGYPHDVGVD